MPKNVSCMFKFGLVIANCFYDSCLFVSMFVVCFMSLVRAKCKLAKQCLFKLKFCWNAIYLYGYA